VPAPNQCEGISCQAPATAPQDPTPGSPSFSGPGNVLECRKGQVKKNGKCIKKQQGKKHKKGKGHKKGKKQKNRRTASHRGGGGK
jgi:hypothetical protein